ncbi:hypothetical protein [Massilia aquatica]|uniref:DUF1640 domain-containing protein n=1 Tax=Massilia aquatica TaxID=2609000 RepID=A0ABX0MAR2_9BURK|nr:hypothetical protein [Massilia aquatica]NHZ41342.1 hypothetical protein [Massilia aquatica]
MPTIPFDTLKMAERLERAGFSIDQAKLQAAMLAEIITAEDASIVEQLASRQDFSQELTVIRTSVEKLDSKIERTGAEAKASIAEAKAELVRWVVGVGFLQIAFIAGLVLKLVR